MTNNTDPDQLASEEATDLDLHCFNREGISRFSKTRVKVSEYSGRILKKDIKVLL